MAEIPVQFAEYTRQLMGDERFERYLQSFEEDIPVSIRLNPQKRLEVRGQRLGRVLDQIAKRKIPNL